MCKLTFCINLPAMATKWKLPRWIKRNYKNWPMSLPKGLKLSMTCHLFLYSAQIVIAGNAKLLVRNSKVLLVSGSVNRTHRRASGYRLAEFNPVKRTCRSLIKPVLGNRPLEPKASKVEFLKSERGFTDEEIKIYRQPDHGRFEAL